MISENFGVNATVDGQCIDVPQDSKKIRKEEGRSRKGNGESD
jgi:hypothetical protein